MDNISSVAWNCQVQHIVSTASTNGYTVVWDLRNKKEVMTLAQAGQSTMTGGKGSISSIAWHPNIVSIHLCNRGIVFLTIYMIGYPNCYCF